MSLFDALTDLRSRLAVLEHGPACVGDWHRFEARVARTLIAASCLCDADAFAVAELQRLRLHAQCRLCELAIDDAS